MYILCDTCSVLMLIRIAPDMFHDDRYGCVTIQEVFQELFRTQKFKTRYPWRTRYKSKIKALGKSKVEAGDFKLYLEAIHVVYRVSEKPLQHSRWDFPRRHKIWSFYHSERTVLTAPTGQYLPKKLLF